MSHESVSVGFQDGKFENVVAVAATVTVRDLSPHLVAVCLGLGSKTASLGLGKDHDLGPDKCTSWLTSCKLN